MATNSNSRIGQWRPDAAVFAWLLPGFGHWLLGDVKRGVVLGVTIGLLWTAGLLIGGLGVIDRQAHPWWFYAQALTAPSMAVEYAGAYADVTPSHGRVNEQGVLYTSLAGLLNLLAILDVLYRASEEESLPEPALETAEEARP